MVKERDDEILFLEIDDPSGRNIARVGNLKLFPEDFSLRKEENFTLNGYRNIYRCDERGCVRLIVLEKANAFKGSRARALAVEVYFSLIPKFRQIAGSQKQSSDAVVKRFAHNLIKFQTRFKAPFDKLMSDKAGGRPFSEMRSEIQKQIEQNTNSAAEEVATLSLRATDLDAQIETLRVLAGYADNTGTFLWSNLKKAMYRLSNPFIAELEKKGVRINNNILDDEVHVPKVRVVHGLFNVSIWQIFDNTCKYILPGTTIEISMDYATPKKLLISMISVTIEENELEHIFLEGRRGQNVKKVKETEDEKGSGIGLHIVRKALHFMKAKITVSNDGFVKNVDNIPYSKHTFTIEFEDQI